MTLAIAVAVARAALAAPMLDPTFGTGGTAPTPARPAIGRTVAVQPDGRIVLAGVVASTPLGVDLAVVRLLADGTPDPSFGTNGRVVQDMGAPEERETALVLQPDGKIVVGATTGPYFSELPRSHASTTSASSTRRSGPAVSRRPPD